MRNLSVQNAPLSGEKSVVFFHLPFAGYDQNKTFAGGLSAKNETGQSRMGLIKGHAVQVYPRFGDQFAPFHATESFSIHVQRCDRGR